MRLPHQACPIIRQTSRWYRVKSTSCIRRRMLTIIKLSATMIKSMRRIRPAILTPFSMINNFEWRSLDRTQPRIYSIILCRSRLSKAHNKSLDKLTNTYRCWARSKVVRWRERIETTLVIKWLTHARQISSYHLRTKRSGTVWQCRLHSLLVTRAKQSVKTQSLTQILLPHTTILASSHAPTGKPMSRCVEDLE